MDKKTKGSWLVHHTNKLQSVNNQFGYENTFVAGKAGILLSAISANKNTTVSSERLEVLAKAANINTKLELPSLLTVLKKQQLIDQSPGGGVAVLGVTTATALQHTSDIFDALNPTANEVASITLAERASESPILTNDVATELADTYKLTNADLSQFFLEAEQIGFVDTEQLGNQKLLFNGNLFRRNTPQKIKAVLDSLTPAEQIKLNELTEILRKKACVPKEIAEQLLGATLFQKVAAIGLFDISVVSNSKENVGFMTLPSAFSKFSSSMVDDAFDLAKAFVSSVTYGMTKSDYARGEIRMVDALLSSLVRGESVGPVRAIAEDYKVLEFKGVVEVKHGTKKGRSGPMLTLLKTEVGELALQAIRQGDVSEHSLNALPSAAVTTFNGPEFNREKVRKTQMQMSPKATNDMLSILRTGGGL